MKESAKPLHKTFVFDICIVANCTKHLYCCELCIQNVGEKEPFCYSCFMCVFVEFSCLLHAALCSPAGRGLTPSLSVVFLSLSHMVSWDSVVLDCIDY